MQQMRGGSEERKPMSQQDRRLKPMQGGENQQQLQQPQKCPRCESLNTKFCYYNNYSLSQPRYFCKTCRRYWTQGGTLRNVPVGGGCRKGKRSKTSTSSENSRSSQSSQPPPLSQQVQQNLTTPQNIISYNPVVTRSPVLTTKEPGNLASPSSIPSMASYYPTGGFLSSLAAIQSLNQPQSFNQSLNQALNIDGGDHIGASSNLGLLQGYSVPSFGSPQYYQMGNREKSVNPIYHPSEESLIHSTRPGSSAQHDWHQGFINNTNPSSSDTAMWSISASSANTKCNTNTGPVVSGSLNPNQWPDLPGYGPPP